MPTKVTSPRTGKEIYLLNPSEKGTKYALELKHNRAITNNLKRKMDPKTGHQQQLSREQRAFRSGYLQARKDSAKAYKSMHPRYKRKTRSR